jgi:DNA-binding response OmpR family regulator
LPKKGQPREANGQAREIDWECGNCGCSDANQFITPLVAYNGQQALALAHEHWPALVITDQMMPLLSGTDLILALQMEATVQQTATLPIVLLSAIEGVVRPDVHVDARLPKPFDLGELEQVIQHLCGRASS